MRCDGVYICVTDGCIVCACNDTSLCGRREYLFDGNVKLYGLDVDEKKSYSIFSCISKNLATTVLWEPRGCE